MFSKPSSFISRTEIKLKEMCRKDFLNTAQKVQLGSYFFNENLCRTKASRKTKAFSQKKAYA